MPGGTNTPDGSTFGDWHVVVPISGVAALLIVCGMALLLKCLNTPFRIPLMGKKIDSEERVEPCNRLADALRPYALQIVGLTFILPVILASSALLKLNSEAITALLGAMIGYIFGSGGTRPDNSRFNSDGNSTRETSPRNPSGPGNPGVTSPGPTGATGTTNTPPGSTAAGVSGATGSPNP